MTAKTPISRRSSGKAINLHGNYWCADEMFMQNHQTGKTTKLKWSNYRFGTGLSSGDFNKNALARLR